MSDVTTKPLIDVRDQRICLGITAAALVAFAAVFATFPGFFPPMSPTMTAQQVADFYRHDLGAIRGSMIAFNLFGVMLVPFFMLILVQLLRTGSPALAYAYLGASAGAVTTFALADLAWLVAAFRPDRDPDLIQLLNDLAWVAFVCPVGLMLAQFLLFATCVYLDRSRMPVFPRWVGAFNVVAAVLTVPGAFAAMNRTGPFAWDGFLAFWLRFATLAVYVVVMWVVLRSVVVRQVREMGELVDPGLVEGAAR